MDDRTDQGDGAYAKGVSDLGQGARNGDGPTTAGLAGRGVIGGILLGFSTTIPGLSSGAMLFISGVYEPLVKAVAEVTGFKFHWRSLLLLMIITAIGGTMVLFVAGIIVSAVESHRWLMYSLFFGLSLGGFQLMLRKCWPVGTATAAGIVSGLAFILALRQLMPESGGGSEGNHLMISVAGFCAASAVLTPGLDGNSLMLGLGYYEIVLGGISRFKDGLLGGDGGGPDLQIIASALRICVPFGVGALTALFTVSHIMRWLLAKHERGVMGVLLGLLLGSLWAIYPFQEASPPAIGSNYRGQPVTQEMIERMDQDDMPVRRFTPTGTQIGVALSIVAVGFGITRFFDLLDNRERDRQ